MPGRSPKHWKALVASVTSSSMSLTSGRNIDRIARHRLLYAEEARRLLAAGQAARAVELCRHGLIYFPEDHTGYVLLANAFIMLGERERALNVLADGYRRTGSPRLDLLRAEVAGEARATEVSASKVSAEEVSIEEVVAEPMPRSAGDSDAASAAALLDEGARPAEMDEATVPIADELNLHAAEPWHDEIEINEIEPESPPHAPIPESMAPDAVGSADAEASDVVESGVGPSAAFEVQTEEDDRAVDLDALDRVQAAISIAMAQVQALRPSAPVDEAPAPAAALAVVTPTDEVPMVTASAEALVEPTTDVTTPADADGLGTEVVSMPTIDSSMSDSPAADVPVFEPLHTEEPTAHPVDAFVAVDAHDLLESDVRRDDASTPDVDPMAVEASAPSDFLERIDAPVADGPAQADQPEAMQDAPAAVPLVPADASDRDNVSGESAADVYPEADLLIAAPPEPVTMDPLVVWQDAMPEGQAQEDPARSVVNPMIDSGAGVETVQTTAMETGTGETSVPDSVHAISPEFVEAVPKPVGSFEHATSREHVAPVETPEGVEHATPPEQVASVEMSEVASEHVIPVENAERPRTLGLALHTVKNAARLRSSNLRLIPGLEFAPLRREDAGRHQSIAPLINEPMPQPELPRRRVSLDAAAMPPLPELEHDGGASPPPPMVPPPPSSAEPAAAEGENVEGGSVEPMRERAPRNVPIMQLPSPDDVLTPLEELARRLERARIPVIDEAEQRMAFAPSLVSETLANILMAQGAYAEALKAFQTLARAKPERLEYFQQRIDEIEQHLERQPKE